MTKFAKDEDEYNKYQMNLVYRQLYLDILLNGQTLRQKDNWIIQSNLWAFIIGDGKLFVE